MTILADLYENCPYSDRATFHSYIPLYERLLEPFRDRPITFLEVGIGHESCTCLKIWSAYFHQQSRILGLDLLPKPNPGLNVTTIQGNSTSPETLKLLPDGMDIVIDDGSHRVQHQIATFRLLFPRLADNGIYLIEDVSSISRLQASIPDAIIHDLRAERLKRDNVVFEVRKCVQKARKVQ